MISADGALTGYENLLIFAKLYDIPRRERASRIRDALAFMDLDTVADKFVRNYSGGMIRRLEIARSMLHRFRVLFLDEPTVGLDPVARAAVWEHVERLRGEYATTIVLTIHLMEEAESLCRRVAIMHRGRVMVVGTPGELKKSIGGEATTMDDVFAHHAEGAAGDEAGSTYQETARARRTAYIDFIAPGILAQSVLFIAIFYGIAIIWERDLGIVHKLLATPTPRAALVLGKALSASALFSTLSLLIAAMVKTRGRFMGIGQVLTMPLFFASNATYPLDIMPRWLQIVAHANPLTYEVDAPRDLMLVGDASVYGLAVDFGVLVAALAVLAMVGARVYPRVVN